MEIKGKFEFQIIETEAAHFTETETGAVMICMTSLAEVLDGEQTTGNKLPIKWINKTGKPIRVNWINLKCEEETSDRLIQPGGIFDGISYTGHIFRVRDEDSKDNLGLIVVKPAISNFNIVK